MEILFGVLIALVVIFALSAITFFLIVRALYRRVRRSRAVNGAMLKSRAQLSRGPRREVFALQMQLDEALRSGRAAMELAVRSNGRRGDLPRLFGRIETEGAALAAQLRLMESETDRAALSNAIASAALAVDQISEMIREVRASVADGLGGPQGAALSSLRAEIDLEVTALHAGLVELAHLNGSYPRTDTTTARNRSREGFQTEGAQ